MLIPAGCTTAPSCPDVHAAVDTDMTLQYGKTEYTCHVRYVTKNNAVLTLLSPENLSGLTFHRSDSICTLSLGTLVCKGTQLLPQDTALAEAVFSVFDRLADPALSCTGTTSDGNYTFALSSAPALSLSTAFYPYRYTVPDTHPSRGCCAYRAVSRLILTGIIPAPSSRQQMKPRPIKDGAFVN